MGKTQKQANGTSQHSLIVLHLGGIATRILNEYKPKDEIWLIAKYYSKQQNGKYYKGFIVREIITEQEIQQASESVFDDLPF